MYGYQEFIETYYHHNCLIVPEKDVLDTDIEGTGWGPRLKRWWKDLFLLSYSTEISKGFYTSSHAMTIERDRQFRKYPNCIHPMSKFRNFWDCLILHVIIINKFLFRITSTLIFDKLPMCFYYMGAICELIIIADLFVNLKTGYVDSETKRVILDTKKSILNFCTKKLFIHSASAIPLHWFMFLRYGSRVNMGLIKTNRFMCALKIISVFSLYRVYETSAYWTQRQHSANKIHCFRFLRIGVVGLITMFQFYDLSDAVCMLVFINNGYVDWSSSFAQKIGMRYTVSRFPNYNHNYNHVYFEISRIFKSFLLFSFGVKRKTYYLDKLTSLVAYLIANGFYAYSLLECYSLVCRIMYPMDQIIKVRNSSLNMLSNQQLSNELYAKVLQYFDFKKTRLNLLEVRNELYRCLPVELKKEAKLSCYLKLVMRLPLFHEWPLEVLEEIVIMLRKEVFLKNDIVSEAWVQGDGLMIVDDGVLAVYSKHYKELGHLIDGDYFGELSLVTDRELCMSFVVAITPCTILILDKMQFRRCMRDYPELFYGLKARVKRKLSVQRPLQNEDSDNS